MNEAWMVRCYNEADAEFGYDSRPFTVLGNCTKAFAKSYARHLNKTAPSFVSYFAEPAPERYW